MAQCVPCLISKGCCGPVCPVAQAALPLDAEKKNANEIGNQKEPAGKKAGKMSCVFCPFLLFCSFKRSFSDILTVVYRVFARLVKVRPYLFPAFLFLCLLVC